MPVDLLDNVVGLDKGTRAVVVHGVDALELGEFGEPWSEIAPEALCETVRGQRLQCLAHLDVDRAEVNKVKRVHWSHIGRVREALQTLIAHGRSTGFERDFAPWHGELAELKRVHAMNYDRASPLIQPNYVIEEINRHTRGAVKSQY